MFASQPLSALLAQSLVALAAVMPAVYASPSFDDGSLLNHRAVQHADALQPDLAAAILLPRAVAATNLQTFQGSVAGVAASAITQSTDPNRPFQVDGDTFTTFESAADRSCDNQHNSCADAVNSKQVKGVTVADCDSQNTQCKSAASSATRTAFTALTSSNAEFDFFCEL